MIKLGQYHKDFKPLGHMEKKVLKERVDAMTEGEVQFILSTIPSDYFINEINNRLAEGTFDKTLLNDII